MRRAGLAAALALAALSAAAGEIGVSPLRIEFPPSAKSAVVTVTGKTGPGQFLQVNAMRWTQDASGNDRYEETGDLVFLPKTIDLAKSGKQLIRLGVEKPATDAERAYRLFIRETPPPADPKKKGAQVSVVVDFGLPVFVMPAKPAPAIAIQDVRLEKGVLSLKVANTGNVRVRLASLTAGKTQFKDFRNWYVLAGASRQFTGTVPGAACKGTLAIQVRTETLTRKHELPVTPQMCG